MSGGSQRIGAAGNLLFSIGDDQEMGGGDRRIVAEPPEIAVETCVARMAKLRVIPGVFRGISFGIDVEPTEPKTSWSIVFQRGPLPLLEIELSDITGFHPPQRWLHSVIESKCAHLVRGESSYMGGGDHLFLMLKRFNFFPYSKGDSSSEAVAAGQRLRELCSEVWQKQSGNGGHLYKLSSWQGRQERFVRKFDQMLQHVGSEKVSAILKEMGTRLESWLPA